MEVCRNEEKVKKCMNVIRSPCMNDKNERKCMEMNVKSLEPRSIDVITLTQVLVVIGKYIYP